MAFQRKPPSYQELAQLVMKIAELGPGAGGFSRLDWVTIQRLSSDLVAHNFDIELPAKHCGGCNWCQGDRDAKRDKTLYHCFGCNECQGSEPA